VPISKFRGASVEQQAREGSLAQTCLACGASLKRVTAAPGSTQGSRPDPFQPGSRFVALLTACRDQKRCAPTRERCRLGKTGNNNLSFDWGSSRECRVVGSRGRVRRRLGSASTRTDKM